MAMVRGRALLQRGLINTVICSHRLRGSVHDVRRRCLIQTEMNKEELVSAAGSVVDFVDSRRERKDVRIPEAPWSQKDLKAV